jgi:dolichol-phosphate mannosyltransferase
LRRPPQFARLAANYAPSMSTDSPDISILVPTLNEAANLPELLRRTDAALAGRAYEVIVIDDQSPDDTPAVVTQLAERYPVRLHVRPAAYGGLSGAVLEGMRLARGRVFVVMDADLQHPPEKVPELVAAVEGGSNGAPAAADFALGSRYVAGGSTAEKWGPLRRFNSRVATLLARPFAGDTRDPMSGFFALRRETYERARRLTPLGYKIGLELMCKCRVAGVREVPIHFDSRAHGRSKLTLAQQFRYLEHLSRLYDFCYPRAAPVVKFLIATGCGWFVGLGAYLLLIARGVSPRWAVPVSYLGAIVTTAAFHLRYVRTQREFLLTRTPWRDFAMVSAGELASGLLAAVWLTSRAPQVHPLEVFVVGFGAATVARYVLRKELMQDIRGLRKDLRREELD